MPLSDIVYVIFVVLLVSRTIRFIREHSWQQYIYSKERPTMLRMEDLRKQYDGVDDLESMIKCVEKNEDVEVYVYCTYSEIAGGGDKEVKIPVSPNSRIWINLCETEKDRLYRELGKAKTIFRLPFHDS